MIIEPVHWHPVLVHFTFALLVLAPCFILAGAVGAKRSWGQASYAFGRGLLWTGVVITVFTIGAGFIAMWNVSVSEEVHHHIHDHRNWALGTATVFVLLALWSFAGWRRGRRPGWVFNLFLIGALGMLLVTGYLGGELVFHHGVSVDAMMQETQSGQSQGGQQGTASGSGHSH